MTKSNIDTKQIQQNIKLSKKLRNQQMNYNGGAAMTTLTAIALYVGGAIALEQQEKLWGAIFIAVAAINNIAAIYCMTQSNKKGRAAMDALKHNTNTKGR